MKNIFKIFIFLNTISITVLTTACDFTNGGGSESSPRPPAPKPPDIKYWQELKQQNIAFSDDTDAMLEEIKNSKDDYDNQQEYQCAIDQVTAEKYFYQAAINNCDYQILLLEKNNIFTPEQKALAIKTLQSKIINLKTELSLKQKYPNDYSQSELLNLNNQIEETQKILEKLLKS